MMQAAHNNAWPDFLPKAVEQLNSRPLKRLNGLSPKDFNSPFDDVKLDPNSMAERIPSIDQQTQNQSNYESNSKQLQLGQFVYVDRKPKSVLEKSYTPKVIFNEF
jgi:hypothetical protein